MVLDLLAVSAGLALLALGGEGLIRGALGLATRLQVTPLLAGVVVLGFGTSAPELLVSVDAALRGRSDISVGNIIGSNIGNILLILGVSAMIAPLAVLPRTLLRDGGVMLAATVVVLLMGSTGAILRWHGAVLLLGLSAYLMLVWRHERAATPATSATLPVRIRLLPALGMTLGGLALLLLGSRLLVNGAVALAEVFGVSEAVIGLTLVAVGTSLPEFAVTLLAAVRRQLDMAVGNVLGSNIFNLLGVLGVTALVTPLQPSARLLGVDGWVMLAAALLLTVFLLTRWRLSRIEGAVLASAYAGYVVWSFSAG